MRYIPKDHEPAAQRAQRETPGATYAPLETVRIALAKEQGYLCAFCMRELDLDAYDKHGQRQTKIAHLLARHPKNATAAQQEERRLLGMSYRNMVLACDGGQSSDTVHCDAQQANSDVTIPLFDQIEMARVTFGSRGQVHHPRFQDQIGHDATRPGLLNLNAPSLMARRYNRWYTIASDLNKKGLWKPGELQKQLEMWDGRDKNGHLREDCQCVVYFLLKSLKLLESSSKSAPKKSK